MITVEHLTKRYDRKTAVDDVSFHVERGEVVGFLGPNGAGKTTTMRILVGITQPTAGRVRVAGHDVTEKPLEVKRRVGYLPEVPPLTDELETLAFLRYAARLKGLTGKRMKNAVAQVVLTCGLSEAEGRMIANLSKGYRQRVGLAQALLANPEVLILDEPTQGLDPNHIVEIRNLIRALSAEHTVVLSTHILSEVVQLCSRAIVIHHGRIVAADTIENLTAEGRSLEQTFQSLTRP